MDRIEAALLKSITLALRGEKLTDDPGLSEAEWVALLKLAAEQEVLPLVYDTVMSCSSFSAADKELRRAYRDKAVGFAARQIVQTNEFLTLMLRMREKGLRPVVFKGVAVRRLYPKPMLRPSVDEDIMIVPGEAMAMHAFLTEEGLTLDGENVPVDGSCDLSYHRMDSPTYIEVHTSFFPKGSEAYGECEAPFAGALERSVEIEVEDVRLLTLEPTDHLLYLMLHAYKHFLHSGMGLRHVCDIGLFAQKERTDCERIRAVCDEMGLSRLFAAVFTIANRYLGLEAYPAFSDIEEEPEPLLADMLSGGLFGTADINRAHSSTLTLEALASHKSGRTSRGALKSVFPPKRALEGSFPILKKHPCALPFVWIVRIWRYATDGKNGPVDPKESLKIGRERIALMRKYGIIDNEGAGK